MKSAAKRSAVRLRTVADLRPDTANANKGTPRGRAMVESSVRQFGFGRSVLVDKHGTLIAGNKTAAAAAATGNDPDVVVVQTTGKQLVVVQRTDLDLATDVAAKELAIADNRAGEVGLVWNSAVLRQAADDGVNVSQFFRPPEWAALTSSGAVTGDDDVPEMGVQPFEHHDYVMVVFTNSQDWSRACELLGLEREAVTLAGGKKKIGLGRVITAARFLAILDAK